MYFLIDHILIGYYTFEYIRSNDAVNGQKCENILASIFLEPRKFQVSSRIDSQFFTNFLMVPLLYLSAKDIDGPNLSVFQPSIKIGGWNKKIPQYRNVWRRKHVDESSLLIRYR